MIHTKWIPVRVGNRERTGTGVLIKGNDGLFFFSMIFNLNFLYVLVHSMNNLKIYLKTKKERKKAKLYAENKGGVHVI